jgi:VWFA-related protein
MKFPVILTAFIGAVCVAGGSAALPGQTSNPTPAAGLSANPLKIESNLVEVRVVVLDGKDQPVTGLKKEDFHLFDRGKEQSIAGFEEQTPAQAAALSGPPPAAGAAQPEQRLSLLDHYIAFFFDTLNTPEADMIQARDAALAYVASGMGPRQKIALFTTDKVLTDFTSDPQRIKDALKNLHSNGTQLARVHWCPDLTDAQAEELVDTALPANSGSTQGLSGAWSVALAEANVCAPPPDPRSMPLNIQILAERIVSQTHTQVNQTLAQFGQVIKYAGKAPGQRTVILVSPGFLSQSAQAVLDSITDQALRAQTVINTINPKGLALAMRSASAASSTIGITNSRASAQRDLMDMRADFVNQDVLAEFAQGTGGRFVHNDNDLKSGFHALADRQDTYVLTFAPRDLKQDGKYHELKVTMTQKPKGYSIAARRGYFAASMVAQKDAPPSAQPGSQPAAETAPNPIAAPSSSGAPDTALEAQAQQQNQQQIQALLDDALKSKTAEAGLTVGMEASPSEGDGDTRMVALTVHVDTKGLPLHNDGGRSQDTVVFAVAVMDKDDKVVEVKQRQAKVSLTEDQLTDFFADGLDSNSIFELKPGSYQLRAAVIETGQRRLGTLTRAVTVP